MQAAEHVGEALASALGMAIGIEIVRPFEQARQHGAFTKREVFCRFAEIAARGHLHAPGAAPKIGSIEVELEDLLFAESILELRSHDHFADLAFVGHVLADQDVLHNLLGNGRTALRPARTGEIADEGTDDAAFIDAVMLEETAILGSHKGFLH